MKYAWHIAQFIALIAMVSAFLIGAPWLGAVPMSEVPREMAMLLPPHCPAASPSHGKFSCQWRGTVKSDPWGFGLCAGVFLGSWVFVWFTSARGLGFKYKRRK